MPGRLPRRTSEPQADCRPGDGHRAHGLACHDPLPRIGRVHPLVLPPRSRQERPAGPGRQHHIRPPLFAHGDARPRARGRRRLGREPAARAGGPRPQRPPACPAPAARKTFDDLIAGALAHWASFDPQVSDDETASRTARLVNDLVTAAIAAGKVEEGKVSKVNKGGEVKRDRAEAGKAARWLYDAEPSFVRKAIFAKLEKERGKLEPAAREPGQEG